MFWIGILVGSIGTILLELLYCVLTLGGYEDDR